MTSTQDSRQVNMGSPSTARIGTEMDKNDVREVLARNLREIRGEQSRLAFARNHGIDVKVVERSEKPDLPAPSVETLQRLAEAIERAPWQLLHPDPAIATISA